MTDHLWKKGADVPEWVVRFTVGDDYLWDRELLPFDARATLAHVHGLAQIGILTGEESNAVDAAMGDLLEDFAGGSVTVNPEDEDCHTVIENYLTSKLGDIGKKVHSGRSRNDQVLAALRLYLRDALAKIGRSTVELGLSLVELGEPRDTWVLPGYTHTRQAMPSSVGAWAFGFAELLVVDTERIIEASRRLNVSPLGSAAGYGVPYLDLAREAVAVELGFQGVQKHVTSVQLSRGKLELDAVHAGLQVALTLNRLSSDLILFSSDEFGFVGIRPEHTTGSSIMPQKQNPDVLELVRASYHRVLAESQLLASLPAGLTSGYHRDLQLTKEAVMRAVVLVGDCVEATRSVVSTIDFDADRIAAATKSSTMATHEAIKMVKEGKPFREAYRSAAEKGGSGITPQEALEAYSAEGYPGNGRPDELRKRLEKAARELHA